MMLTDVGARVPRAWWSLLATAIALASCDSEYSERSVLMTSSATEASRQARFAVTVSQASPPPPISGGTLTIAPDGKTAVAADPDRDRIFVVDLSTRSLLHEIALPEHAEPGRVAIDDRRRAYVALRRGGGIAEVDLDTGALSHREACDHPRGVAHEPLAHVLHVACASGELIDLPLDGGTPSSQMLKADLRDVVMVGNAPVVSRFRSAELHSRTGLRANTHGLAWRAVALPPDERNDDEIAVVGQRPPDAPLPPSAWGGPPVSPPCPAAGSFLVTELSLFQASRRHETISDPTTVVVPNAVLPVDLATNGRELVVVAAGNAYAPNQSQIFTVSASILRAGSPCANPALGNVPGQAVAAAFAADDALIVQTREPAALFIMSPDRRRPITTIRLSDVSRADAGHALFHANAGGSVACASCHAEGADDGRVWSFAGVGARRTPSLLGTLQGTAPYHWQGEMADMHALVEQIFARMGGPKLGSDDIEALGKWVVGLPARGAVRAQSEATLRGAATFGARCEQCHSGPEFTNNRSMNVGTGGWFQVPSLRGVAWRPPYLHTGCAATLRERFAPGCGGTAHGDSGLSEADIDDLVAYLETL